MNAPVNNNSGITIRWYFPLLAGIVLVLSGIYLWTVPEVAYTVIVGVFGLALTLSAFSELIFYAWNRKRLPQAGWHLAGAAAVLAAGIFLLLNPAVTTLVITLLVAFHLLVKSVQNLLLSLDMKETGAENWYLLTLSALLGIALSLAIAAQPLIISISLVLLTGMSFIFAGITGIVFSLVLKRLATKRNRGNTPGDAEYATYELIED